MIKMHCVALFLRNYSTANKTIIKEIVKHVHPFSKFKLSSTMNLTIKPYDLFECPNADVMRAVILGPNLNDTVPLNFNVEVKNDTVQVMNTANTEINKECTCILEVPVKSNLDINAENNVEISEMHGDSIKLITHGDIMTKNLRSISTLLHSTKGSINCEGLLLAQNIHVKTDSGNIHLDKLQGDYLECESINGTISTNSCYTEHSKFTTKNGNLFLKNVHKRSEVLLTEEGSVKMVGIHGNINVKGNASNMDLHFDELYGENVIISNEDRDMKIHISDKIEKECCIEIYAEKIILDSSIQHLNNCLQNEKYFHSNIENNHDNKLLITTQGLLLLGKKSWADNIKSSLGMNYMSK